MILESDITPVCLSPSDRSHRASGQHLQPVLQPAPQDRLSLRDGSEREAWSLRHRQQERRPWRRRLPGRSGADTGTGKCSEFLMCSDVVSALPGGQIEALHLKFKQVSVFQIVSSKSITRPLQLKKGKPAGKGSITVRTQRKRVCLCFN